jgi:hypothetical protein
MRGRRSTGSPQGCVPGLPTRHCRIASRTTPTLCVFMIATGPSRRPLSSIQVVPVLSPLPFNVNHAANTGSALALPRGWITVTPVRTGIEELDQLTPALDPSMRTT